MRSKGVTAERVSPSSRCPSFSERPGSGRLSLPASWWLWVWLIVLVAGGNALAADRAEEQPTAGSGSGSGDAVHATDRSDTTGGSPEAEVLVVYGRGEPQLAHARSGSEGRISGADLELRPIARVGELLETVPGMIATQHSGPGKATQLFLRGFNLDHGTDFAAFYDGVPVNFRTHGHGQGYLDLNFVIPELVESIDYRKGPYRADVGDFGSAGAAFFRTRDRLPDSLATLTVGQDGYVRGLAATNVETGSTDWIVALEAKTYDDPYRLDANLLHLNGLAKLTRPAGPGTLRASVLGYHATWNSTDQIPRRAIGNPDPALRVSRLGFIDPDLGGETTRVGLTLDWQEESDHPTSLATYFLYYRFRLFSDFTYFRDNPPPLGDEFEQTDRRFVWGARGRKDWAPELFGSPVTIDAGFDTRIDVVTDLGLFRTSNRHRFATVRRDDVVEGSGSLFAEFEWSPFEWMTWQAGLRGDLLVFDVDTGAGLGASSNSGTDVDGLVSPKLALILRPSDTVEIYVDGGGGFHSNDARGATIRIDPTTGLRTRRVDPIARQWGSEVGLRWQPNERLHLTGVLWFLDSESELVFAGDSGTTVPQGGSRRYGVELTGFFRPFHWLAFDASFARSHAEFKGLPSGRDRIPNAIEQVVSAGVTLSAGGWAGSLRVRHFGSYPLVEDDTQRAGSTTLVHLGASYEWGPVTLGVTVLNLLDSRDNEIEYFFASRLAGEAAPVPDVHLHPVAPRQVRGTLTLRF